MTPAARLRQAAQLARETAEAATPGPWGIVNGRIVRYENGYDTGIAANPFPGWANHWDENAAHIALWSPPVALAVTAWLERTAERMDEWATKFSGALRYEDGRLTPSTYAGFFEAEDWQLALTAADALLAGIGERVP